MSKHRGTSRTYHSSREVFEAFIPGYIAPVQIDVDEEGAQQRSPEEIKATLLKELQKKLDDLDISASG